MIVLDTNVVSELMKATPARRVVDWIAAQPATSLYTTSVTQAEILHGIALLPSGKRRRALEVAAEAMFRDDFDGRVLPFGSDAAPAYARIAVERRRAGRPISQFDAQIAAIARSADASIATRNVADYDACGVKVIDPWRDDESAR
ncbi:MAG: type II toxin-antitoxin system VapC family toxin [Candidatus Binatia bacterium]